MRMTTLAGVLVGLSLMTVACGDDGGDAATTAATADEPTTESTGPTDPTTDGDSATDSDSTSGADSATGADSTTDGDVADSTEPATGDSATSSDSADESVPAAIVSLSPSATEMLYAIGAGDQVLAVDDYSNYPPETADKMPGVSAFEPNVEAIAGLDPDLIVTDGTNPDLLDQLDQLGIEHWEGTAATSFDDVYTQIEQLGALTAHVAEAAALVGAMQADVAAVKAGLPELDQPLTYYHELDETYFSVTSSTFIGAVYAEIGLVNIADEAGVDTPYPQLNAEYIIQADPDLIFLACSKYCGTTAASVAQRPGWGGLTAVTTGGVIEVDDDVASRWGPRIVDYLRQVGDAVATVTEAVGA